MDYDFCGWATKNNLKCSDGVTIRKGAFSHNDGKRVPLVWNHQHKNPGCVLGHAVLEERDEGIYAYCRFNDTQGGRDAKEMLRHGDIDSLSIWADQLNRSGQDIFHGNIREVSLVLAGANPGAYVESVISHGEPMDESDDEGIFYTGEGLYLEHAIEGGNDKQQTETKKEGKTESSGGKTVGQVFATLNEEQKKAVAIIVGQAIEDAQSEENDDEEGDENKESGKENNKTMKHNLFEKTADTGEDNGYLSHDALNGIIADAKKIGSLREAIRNATDGKGIIAHSIDATGMESPNGAQTYGFNDPSMLFPDYKTTSAAPEWIMRNMDWVDVVMSNVGRNPFSRIKSVFADITEDEARARGYIKGKQKKTEVFSILKRKSNPTTVYKLQKMDRDDIIDITDFDVVTWIRAEMRVMLNEEIARAILIGDGRLADAEDHIDTQCIRPIAEDVPLFNVKIPVSRATTDTDSSFAEKVIDAIIRSRKKYKGSGNPIFFTTEDVLTEMLLLKDGIGHKLYKTEAELATTLRVSRIETVEPMAGHKITVNNKEVPLIGIIVNLKDYKVGTDKGGQITNFDDFDIDFNKYTYLIETRMSGALVKPFSALTIYENADTTTSAEQLQNDR